jgi:peptidoglycan/xylan/chitin deacetylase (PgdA/CDA1 family)
MRRTLLPLGLALPLLILAYSLLMTAVSMAGVSTLAGNASLTPVVPSPTEHSDPTTVVPPTPSASPTLTPSPPPSATPSPTASPSATPRPTSTPSPPTTPTRTPTPTPTEDPVVALQRIRPNELGWIIVLEYHLIEEPEARWSRTPANFRRDIERLIAEGYYPINLIDLALGQINVPAGKTPLVLTFDDSSSGQFRYLPDGTVDPDSAVGILLAAARQYPNDWRTQATFFVLLDVDVPDRILFGQPEWAEQKLLNLIEWGMEVGSHTISHFRLSDGTPEQIRWQLAVSEETIESMIPGYEVLSLSVPLGLYPEDEDLLRAGEWEGQHYDFQAVVEVAGGPSPSPFSTHFDPYHIRRVQATAEQLDTWLGFFQDHPELRFVSDGDPTVVTAPDPLPAQLEGSLREDLIVQWYPAAP